MFDLSRIYYDRFNILLCLKNHEYIKSHTFCLRERIEDLFHQIISIKSGNGYKLIRDKINFLSYAEEENYDKDAVACTRFLGCLKKFQHTVFHFLQIFEKNCQEKSVLPALLTLLI